jgi:ATP-dependent exoDNAse (exonuclease V) beta subunit
MSAHVSINPSPNVVANPTAQALRQAVLAMGLNPQQQAACQHPYNQGLQVLAGAGTGKTLLITARYLWLLADALDAGLSDATQRLWVLTFTEAAAAEMRHRIHKALLVAGYEGALPTDTLGNFNQLGQRLLRQHATRLGFTQAPTTLDATAQQQRLAQLVTLTLNGQLPRIEQALKDQGLGELNPNCLHPNQLAQWPTASREALLQSFVQGIESVKALGLSPAEAYHTLKRQQAAWQQALTSLPLVNNAYGLPIDTKDALAAAWGQHLAPWAAPQWVETMHEGGITQAKQLTDLIGETLWKDTGWFNAKAGTKAKLAWTPLAHDRQQATAPLNATLALEQQVLEAFCAFYAVYQQSLATDNACDFNDQITLATRLFTADPALAHQYQQAIRAVLVDEFQDTNGAQLALLRQLLLPPKQGCNLTVVGDVKQAIYGFRYAQPHNLQLAFTGYAPPTTVALGANYRSVPAIVGVANRLTATLTHNDERQQVQATQPEQPQPTPQAGTPVHVWVIDKAPQPSKANPSPLSWPEGAPPSARAWEDSLIVEELTHLLASGNVQPRDVAILYRSHSRALSLEPLLAERGIPYLKQQDSSLFELPVIITLHAALRAWLDEIPSPHALLRLLEACLPQASVARVWRACCDNLPKGDQPTLASFIALYSHPLPKGEGVDNALARWLAEGQTLAHSLPPVAWAQWVVSSGQSLLWQRYAATPEALQQQALTLAQWAELWATLASHEGLLATPAKVWPRLRYCLADKTFSFNGLLRNDGLTGDTSPHTPTSASQHNAVRLMSIHASKGLEFNVVFVAWGQSRLHGNKAPLRIDGAEWTALTNQPQHQGFGLLLTDVPPAYLPPSPSSRGGLTLTPTLSRRERGFKRTLANLLWHKPNELAELQRVLYVALTRAKHRLYWLVQAKSLEALELGQLPPAEVTVLDNNDLDEATALLQRWPSLPLAEAKIRLQAVRPTWLSHPKGDDDTPSPLANVRLVAPAFLPPPPSPPEVLPAWHLSFSAWQTWQRCPTQFWWQHVAKVPAPASTEAEALPTQATPQRLAAWRGTWVHKAIEQTYRQQASLSLQALVALAPLTLAPPWGETLLAEVQTLLARFEASDLSLPHATAQGWRVLAPELKLKANTGLTLMWQGEPRHVVLTGQVDALLHNPATETARLVDFKTNQHLSASKLEADTWQLALYRQALRQAQPQYQLPPELCQVAHLSTAHANLHLHTLAATTNDTLRLALTLEAQGDPLAVWQAWLPTASLASFASLSHATQAPQPNPTPSAKTCQQCAYLSLCPVAQAT